MAIWSMWWAWMAGALALATLEVLAPGYVFLGFAGGAAATGLLLLVVTPGLPLLLVIFAVLSGLTYVALRKLVGLRTGQVKIWDRDIND